MGGYDFDYFFGEHGYWGTLVQCMRCQQKVFVCKHPILHKDQPVTAEIYKKLDSESIFYGFTCPCCRQENYCPVPPELKDHIWSK